jgi:hypothetical protein
VDEVTVGAGDLAGRGVYAARDLAAGEVVVAYRLRPLDEAGYRALPAGEELFVHSFGGRRYLYPAPARYVNHSDDPSCFQDFDRCCDIARRPIAAGEPITIDSGQETGRELATFLDAYGRSLVDRSAPALSALVAADASVWLAGRAFRGRDAVVTALLDGGPSALSGVEWLIGTGRWEALCAAGSGTGPRVTMLLKVVTGNWQMVYEHVG